MKLGLSNLTSLSKPWPKVALALLVREGMEMECSVKAKICETEIDKYLGAGFIDKIPAKAEEE